MTIFTDERGRPHPVKVLQQNVSYAYIEFSNGRCETVRVAALSEPDSEEPPAPPRFAPKPKKAKP